MNLNKDTKIAVLCGGISEEREVSLRSGDNIYKALCKKGYKNSKLIDIKSIDDIISIKGKFDIAFLTTHGRYGEDGSIQGILDWLKIPYTGSSVLASSVAMDKALTKKIAISIGLSTAKYKIINNNNLNTLDLKLLWDELSNSNGAVFLKPNGEGSSVNTFKIKSLEDLKSTLSKLDLSKTDYILEEYIAGREITVSVIEKDKKLITLPILELKPKNEFYDYEAKYTKGMTEFILPAKFESSIEDKINNDTLLVFKEVGCTGFGRVDFIVDKNGNNFLLEINPLPGMTDTSDLPAQAKCHGIEYGDVVEIILQSARRHK